VHDAHRGTSRFAGPKLIGGPSPRAVEHGCSPFQVWCDRAGYDFDRIIRDCKDDRVGSLHPRMSPATTGYGHVVQFTRFQRTPQRVSDPAAPDDQNLHSSPE
jgi:hypothetical protein